MLPSQHYRQPEAGAVLTTLHEINTRCGYLTADEVRRAAIDLGVPLSVIYSAATFYALFSFKPCGKHKLQVCEGTACYVKGAAALLALEAKVKELGIDKIALHVFAHNHVARALYEKAGFEITGIYLTKKLTR